MKSGSHGGYYALEFAQLAECYFGKDKHNYEIVQVRQLQRILVFFGTLTC